MQSAWKWSPWVGSLQSDSANSYFTTMINSSKMITSCSNMINMSPPLDIDLSTAGTWTLGLVERDLKALSTMVFATWAIVDFSSGEDPCILVLVMAFQESKLTKNMSTNLGGPGENGFLVRVQQDERVLLIQARDLWSLGLLLLSYESNRQSPSHLLGWSSQIKNHLLLHLVDVVVVLVLYIITFSSTWLVLTRGFFEPTELHCDWTLGWRWSWW